MVDIASFSSLISIIISPLVYLLGDYFGNYFYFFLLVGGYLLYNIVVGFVIH